MAWFLCVGLDFGCVGFVFETWILFLFWCALIDCGLYCSCGLLILQGFGFCWLVYMWIGYCRIWWLVVVL